MKLAIMAASTPLAQQQQELVRHGQQFVRPEEADVMLVIGGDGTLLHTMRHWAHLAPQLRFYGINAGSHGFLMNHWRDPQRHEKTTVIDIMARLEKTRPISFPTLQVTAELLNGQHYENFAINEISVSRASPQAIKMKLNLDGHDRISNMVGDGMLLATPQGSTAYNFACHGPILPLGSSLMALTPISLFRPRRWPGAVVRKDTKVEIELQETEKRPGIVAVDAISGGAVKKLTMTSHPTLQFYLLVDKDYDLEERIIMEQFEV